MTLGPYFYHGGFKAGCDVAKVTNFADFTWPNVARSAAKNTAQQRPIMKCTILIERNLKKNAEDPFACRRKQNKTNQYQAYRRRLVRVSFQNLSIAFFNAEKKIYHFVTNDSGNVRHIKDGQQDYDKLIRFEYKQEPYLFAQIGLICKQDTIIFCLNHVKNVRKKIKYIRT